MRFFTFILIIWLTSLAKASEWKLELNQILMSRMAAELVIPTTIFPSLRKMDLLTQTLLRAESTCLKDKDLNLKLITQESQNNPIHKKLLQWVMYHCKIQNSLSNAFFMSPPYMTPLGISWVLKAHQSGHAEFASKEWLLSMFDKTHFLEISNILDETELLEEPYKLYSQLTPDQLNQLIHGEPMLITKNYTIMKSTNPIPISYLVKENTLSNLFDSKYFLYSIISFLILAVLIIIALITRLISTKRQFWKDRELMMQTIAHELRHPVTSLQLSLEVYRNAYDAIPSDAQTEFLRMSGQIQRLFRIIHASGQYLRTSQSSEIPFQFKSVTLESFNGYIKEVLADYLQKISITFLSDDRAFTTDPYWLSVCLTNLIKNALIHGAPPVHIKIELKDEFLNIEVSDQGSLNKNLKDLTTPFLKSEGSQGMGLGLTIVSRIVQMMGGRLSIKTNPTRFQFYIKELKNEKTLVS